MSDNHYTKIHHPFMEATEANIAKGVYKGPTTIEEVQKTQSGIIVDGREFGTGKNRCTSKNAKGRQCSLVSGHDGQHEHWQFYDWVTKEDLKDGCEYRGEPHAPWELGMRIRVWSD